MQQTQLVTEILLFLLLTIILHLSGTTSWKLASMIWSCNSTPKHRVKGCATGTKAVGKEIKTQNFNNYKLSLTFHKHQEHLKNALVYLPSHWGLWEFTGSPSRGVAVRSSKLFSLLGMQSAWEKSFCIGEEKEHEFFYGSSMFSKSEL